MTGYVLLANVSAGNAQQEQVEVARAELRTHGPVEVARSEDAEDIDRILDGLSERRLVVAGGDGSIHLVVQRLHDRGELDTDLALVPLGTGNDLARGLDLPLEARHAAEVAATGVIRHLDLLVDEQDGVVVNAVHAGVGAEAAQRSEGMKDGLGPLAYPAGALVAGLQEEGWRLTVTVDGEPIHAGDDDRLLMVAIANGRTIGGGAPLAPSAEPDDGRLDVVVVGAVGPAARTAFAAALRDGRHLEREDVTHRRGEEVRISGEPVRFNADGEVSDPVPERTYRLRRAAWRVRVPGGG